MAMSTLNTRLTALARQAAGALSVYPVVAPEGAAYPLVTLQEIHDPTSWETHDRAAFPLRSPEWQFTATARSMSDARQISNALKRIMLGHQDEQIRRISFGDELEDYETATRLYRVILVLRVLAYEDQPA